MSYNGCIIYSFGDKWINVYVNYLINFKYYDFDTNLPSVN